MAYINKCTPSYKLSNIIAVLHFFLVLLSTVFLHQYNTCYPKFSKIYIIDSKMQNEVSFNRSNKIAI